MAKLYIGADHAGYGLKEKIKDFLDEESIKYEDLTPKFDEKDDYPDPARKVGKEVVENDAQGILFCGTGIGVSIAANKVEGVRAARVTSINDAEMAKKHNKANIITIGGRTTTTDTAKRIVKTWLDREFEGGRHQRRVDKIKDIEEKC